VSDQIDAAKPGIIAEHKLHDSDTGSPEVQIALLTARINHLNDHLGTHLESGHRAALIAYWYTTEPLAAWRSAASRLPSGPPGGCRLGTGPAALNSGGPKGRR
jgi:hypothetical protein